jgi:DNA-binding transcriptional ArsR family regulator
VARRRRLAIPAAEAEQVLVSPARQELLSAIGLHGPCSVRELASRLGRSVTSLYYHLGMLERVGAVAQEQRGQETLWRAAVDEIAVAPARRASSSHASIAKAVLRLTTREVEAALRDSTRRRGEPGPRVVALRSKAWLDEAQLRAIDKHFTAISAILQQSETARRGAAIYAVTLVLAPVRERKAGKK